MRGRGLKLVMSALPLRLLSSPPMRGRGLKLELQMIHQHKARQVAPHAGAWIETNSPSPAF